MSYRPDFDDPSYWNKNPAPEGSDSWYAYEVVFGRLDWKPDPYVDTIIEKLLNQGVGVAPPYWEDTRARLDFYIENFGKIPDGMFVPDDYVYNRFGGAEPSGGDSPASGDFYYTPDEEPDVLDDSGAYDYGDVGVGVGVGVDLSVVSEYIRNISNDWNSFTKWLDDSWDYHSAEMMKALRGNIFDPYLSMEQRLDNFNNVDDVAQNALLNIGAAYLAQGIAGTVAGADRQINRDIGIWQGDMVKYGSFQNVLFYANMYAIKEFLYDGVKYNTGDYVDNGNNGYSQGGSGGGAVGYGSDAYWYYARPGSYGVVQGVGGWMRSKFGDYLIKKRI